MKNNHTLKQLYYTPRTAIEAEILFTARVKQVRFLERLSGKTPREQNSSGKKIGAESAVPILVYLCIMLIVHKYRQSAKERCLLKRNTMPEVFPLTAGIAGSGKTKPFEKRRSRYKETAENKAEAYRVYGEHLFSACDAVDARIFSNMWRSFFKYGKTNYNKLSISQIWEAAQKIYADYPELLKAAAQTLGLE